MRAKIKKGDFWGKCHHTGMLKTQITNVGIQRLPVIYGWWQTYWDDDLCPLEKRPFSQVLGE